LRGEEIVTAKGAKFSLLCFAPLACFAVKGIEKGLKA